MKINLLIDCKFILEKSELIVFNVEKQSRFFNWIWLPIMQFITGLKDVGLPTSIGAAIWFVLFLGTMLVTRLLDLPADVMNYAAIVCILLPVIAMLFATPSSYSMSGLTDDNVGQISKLILQKAENEKSKVELLDSCFDILEQRIDSRSKFYRMLIGAYWAYNILFVNLIQKQITSIDVVWKSILDASFYLALCWLLYLSYKRGSDILMRTLRLAFKNAASSANQINEMSIQAL
ncbi:MULTISPECIES: hypothetical protein [unclassified Vibrio]|uniref:hypothetical protein n=1 Tax=unclassified Vibrio TaxID=2614977 RepID=UPI0012682E56|nr:MULTISPECIES: hypothetical protein [unclassified Vibrio]QFT37721.1 hypothetical protein FIU99_15010 [Vibrio sp. THAF64]QGM35624.1 hypothetical protein GGC04_15020 [Vibrio sp. THAF191d]QGN71124.1 hypothetical protein GGC03_15015 [Vibrio sp. THAF191c]